MYGRALTTSADLLEYAAPGDSVPTFIEQDAPAHAADLPFHSSGVIDHSHEADVLRSMVALMARLGPVEQEILRAVEIDVRRDYSISDKLTRYVASSDEDDL